MIKERYVSLEIAGLLKENGFDETCYACYEYFSSNITMYSGWTFEYKGVVVNNSEYRVKCPTLQLTLRWLREVHDIFIQPCIVNGATITTDQRYYFYNIFRNRGKISCSETYYNIPEEATEAAIKYCLENLI